VKHTESGERKIEREEKRERHVERRKKERESETGKEKESNREVKRRKNFLSKKATILLQNLPRIKILHSFLNTADNSDRTFTCLSNVG
jgi:hypothetical protein